MVTKIFIGKLSFTTTSESLRELFSTYGPVESAQIATDRDSKRSKGFGFVEMENRTDAETAISELDGKTFEGREIVVNVARPREDRPQNRDRGNFRDNLSRR